MSLALSVVVICLDEARYVTGCLTALAVSLGRAGAPSEIVVVDGGSSDGTVAVVEAWRRAAPDGTPLVRAITSASGYGRQRNAGVRAAGGRWVAFVSADVRVPPEWAAELVVAATDPDLELLVGRFCLVPEAGRNTWLPRLVPTLYPDAGLPAIVGRCSTVNLAVRRDVLMAHPFDVALPACEDKDLAIRLAPQLNPRAWDELKARPEHLARERFGTFLRKLHHEARALGQLSARYGRDCPDLFGWRRQARSALGATIVVAGGSVVAGVGYPVAGAVVAGAAMIVGGVHRHGWQRRRGRGRVTVLAVRHVVAIWTIACGYGRGRLEGALG
jgi:glycosyltransferase involved in cell wall biosynthesis